MPSVVHHKDTVCLRGGQLGGEDINRERKEGLEGVGWGRGSREKHRVALGEAAFNFMYLKNN